MKVVSAVVGTREALPKKKETARINCRRLIIQIQVISITLGYTTNMNSSSVGKKGKRLYLKNEHSNMISFLPCFLNSPERIVPKGYRPPSPKWVSRAGGVAIMRTKKNTDDEYY